MDVVKCNIKFDGYIEYLRKIADNSTLLNKHSAVLFKKDKILSFGYNRCIRTQVINDQNVKFSIHAEIDAIYKFNSKKIKYMDILIIRIGNPRTGKLRNSRPCNSCIEKLSQYDIRRVYYSDQNGDIVYETLDNMKRIHVSSGHQFLKNVSN